MAAVQKGIGGTVLIQCTVPATGGHLLNCRIVQSVPELDGVALAGLSGAYEPATFFGRKVQVDYVFRYSLEIGEKVYR